MTASDTKKFTRQLAEQYQGELHRFLLRRLHRTRLNAEDVAQESFLRLLRVEHTELIRTPRAYLYRIAASVIWELELKEQRNPVGGAVDGLDPEVAPAAPGSVEEEIEHASSIEKALRGLPNMQRAALLMLKRDGKSYKEIARELNLSIYTVKKYLYQAVAHCRQNGWQ